MNTSSTLKKPLLPSLLTTAIGATFLATSTASAIVTLDLRAVSISPGAGTVEGPKSVKFEETAPAGSTVTFELWAIVTGTNGIVDEALTSVNGFTLMSSPGTLALRDTNVSGNTALTSLSFPSFIRGNLVNALNPPWNTATTSSNGALADLDGDGDIDVGTTAALPNSGYISANAGGSQTTGTPGNFNELANGREWKLSIATFTVQSLGAAGGGTGVNAMFAAGATGLSDNARASFNQDAGTAESGGDAFLAVAAPVVLQVIPEPSVAVTLLGGVATLLGLRRRKH